MGSRRAHIQELEVDEEVFEKPLDTAQDLSQASSMVKGRAARITTLAREAVAQGMDPDTAWKHACAKVSCAPQSVSLAYNIFLTLITKPSNA